jgi:hypothetical protein
VIMNLRTSMRLFLFMFEISHSCTGKPMHARMVARCEELLFLYNVSLVVGSVCGRVSCSSLSQCLGAAPSPSASLVSPVKCSRPYLPYSSYNKQSRFGKINSILLVLIIIVSNQVDPRLRATMRLL